MYIDILCAIMNIQRIYFQVYTDIIAHNFFRVMITFEVWKNLHKVLEIKQINIHANTNYVLTIADFICIAV